MYTQIFLMTSVRGRVLAPQIVAIASLSFFGAKMPFPAFFMAAAFFLDAAAREILPAFFFSAVIFFKAAFVIFATVVFATVLVVVVIAIEGSKCKHALSLRENTERSREVLHGSARSLVYRILRPSPTDRSKIRAVK